MPDIQVLNELPTAALLVALFFGTFVSEDAACVAAGTLAANGRIELVAAIGACFLGIFVGDMLLYAAGRFLGARIFDNRLVRRFVSVNSQAKAARWLDRNSASAVFLSRFVTGLRLPTYLAAGALRTDLRKFAIRFLLASAVWTPILVGSSAFFQKMPLVGSGGFLGFLILFVLVRSILKYSSGTNRRLAVGRIKRIVKWEFWPLQIFYIPVVLHVLWLGIKHRSLTVFTAVNPAFPAGGFKGESKSDIYRAIGNDPDNRQYLLKYSRILEDPEPRSRLAKLFRSIEENNFSFPLVVKPDAGERGKGVSIVKTVDELTKAVLEMRGDFLLQEFMDGVEASIFYYRRSDEPRGHIFSITEKRFPTVIGDGVSTLEGLILRDARAVCMARKYFEQLGERTSEIPNAGAAVRLIDIGTHSRGAIFADGGWMLTPELECVVDDLCRRIKGFYFGRFDVKAASVADLRAGLFKVIELNGVTSESTNIYDLRYSLFDAYRILFEQWSLAFEIGAANTKSGARATSVIDVIKLAAGWSQNDRFDNVFLTVT